MSIEQANQSLAQGNYAHAFELVQTLLKKSPEDASLYFMMGEICLRAGKIEAAMGAYFTTLKLSPNHGEAFERLAIIHQQRGELDKAWQFYKNAAAIKPSDAELRLQYACSLADAELHEQATQTYFEVLELIRSEHSHIYFDILLYLDPHNDTEALERLVACAEKYCRDDTLTKLCKGTLAFENNAYEEALGELESIAFVKNKSFAKKEAFRTSMLVRIYDRLKRYDDAMAATNLMNQMTWESTPDPRPDKHRYLHSIQERRDYFTQANVSAWAPLAEEEQEPPVFLVGFPRSGTTLLNNMLHSHDDIEVIEEKHMIHEALSVLMKAIGRFERLKDIDNHVLAQVRQTYWQELAKHREGQTSIIIDKHPLNLISVGLIHRIFPKAKFILALRHPCDCVLSCTMNWFQLNTAMANTLSIEDSAHLYDRAMDLWEQYCAVLPLQTHTVRYEDIVADREAVLRPLMEFLEKPWDDAMLEHHKTAQNRGAIYTPSYNQVTQKIYKHATYRWERYQSFMQPHLLVLQPWIERWGYAQSPEQQELG